jgi:lipopolysaccharide/colanic/teichoic acid biosynthesis glycosyltransferase
MIDVIASGAALVVLAPVLILAAIAVRSRAGQG